MSVNDYDVELHEAINDLVDEGYLIEGTTAYGIARLAVDVSYNSLTAKQQYVFDTVVVPTLEKRIQRLIAIQHMNSRDYILG